MDIKDDEIVAGINFSKIDFKIVRVNHIQKDQNVDIITYLDNDGISNEFFLEKSDADIILNENISICIQTEKNVVLKYLTKVGKAPVNTKIYIDEKKRLETYTFIPNIYMLGLDTIDVAVVEAKDVIYKKSLYITTFLNIMFSLIFVFCKADIFTKPSETIFFYLILSIFFAAPLIMFIQLLIWGIHSFMKKSYSNRLLKIYNDFDFYAETKILKNLNSIKIENKL